MNTEISIFNSPIYTGTDNSGTLQNDKKDNLLLWLKNNCLAKAKSPATGLEGYLFIDGAGYLLTLSDGKRTTPYGNNYTRTLEVRAQGAARESLGLPLRILEELGKKEYTEQETQA